MLFPFISIEVVAVFTTMCLWGWSRWRTRFLRLSQEREQIRRQNKLAHLTFFLLLILEVASFSLPQQVGQFLIPAVATFAFLRFAIQSGKLREGFWSKRRNQLASSLVLIFCTVLAPFFTSASVIAPWLYSLWVTQICLSNIAKIFRENIRDLEALQSKLLKLEADLQAARVMANGAASTAPSSVAAAANGDFEKTRRTVGA